MLQPPKEKACCSCSTSKSGKERAATTKNREAGLKARNSSASINCQEKSWNSAETTTTDREASDKSRSSYSDEPSGTYPSASGAVSTRLSNRNKAKSATSPSRSDFANWWLWGLYKKSCLLPNTRALPVNTNKCRYQHVETTHKHWRYWDAIFDSTQYSQTSNSGVCPTSERHVILLLVMAFDILKSHQLILFDIKI